MEICDREIHLYFGKYSSDESDGNRILSLNVLSAEEKTYVSSCAGIRKSEFATSRYLLRSILSKYCPSVSPSEWKFEENKYGKLSCPGTIEFNLSHSKGNVVLAFMKNGSLGIDIELLSDSDGLSDIAKSHFSKSESEELHLHRGLNLKNRFFEYWTMKEAFIKALGIGISIGLDKFSFIFNNPKCTLPSDGNNISLHLGNELHNSENLYGKWGFFFLDWLPNFQLALAARISDDGVLTNLKESNSIIVSDNSLFKIINMGKIEIIEIANSTCEDRNTANQ